jgi:hypothetical protein
VVDAGVYIDFNVGMESQDGCVGLGIRWTPIKLKATDCIQNSLREGFKLRALEWLRVA